MELIVVAIVILVGATLLALTLFSLVWKIVSPAVDNLLDWAIHTFGNERAREAIENKWRNRDT